MSLFSCKDTTRLLSEALDTDVSASRRLIARVHLLFCTQCTRWRKHLRFLRRAARTFDNAASRAEMRLSAHARKRILLALKQQEDAQ